MIHTSAPTHYCDSFGFDADWRKARLDLLGLSPQDAALARRLRTAVVEPNADALIEAFYAKLLADAESSRLLAHADRERLAHRQIGYLLRLGEDFTNQAYFEDRLRIGLVHAWVGVPLGLYLCAYQALESIIEAHIERCIEATDERRLLSRFLHKIAALDTSLASEVYHIAQIRHLESSVARLRDERAQLRHQAGTDALTGLANRASILPRLSQALAEAVRADRPLCVIMADLDRFKAINDSFGHPAGDQVLRDAAARLGTILRDFDLVGRYGGEEFIAVLRNTDLDAAMQIAERVRRRFADHAFEIGENARRITISQGVALAHPGDSVDSLIARADAALYAAKQAGRDCVMAAQDPE
ncbi:MAG: diguanylate cyclase [Thiohalobacteraceae bacterium]